MWNSKEQPKNSVPAAPPLPAPAPAPAPVQPVKAAEPPAPACIGQSITIKGAVVSNEDLTIDGRVEGTIEIGNHNLVVGAGATVLADLAARTITINGSVKGNVTAQEKIDIREQGSVTGDLTAPRIAMREGAVVRGRVDTSQARRSDVRPSFPVAV